KFATRFSKKLYGDLIEEKWNKKLIGLSSSLPTEQDMLKTYAKIVANVETLWYKKPIEIVLSNRRFEKLKNPFEDQQAVEHLKYSISEPSANFIVDHTLNLGTSLLNLANLGTLDEFQEELVKFLIRRISKKIEESIEPHNANWLISEISRILLTLEGDLNKFIEYSEDFLTTGKTGDLMSLLEHFKRFITNKGKLEDKYFEEICEISIRFISQSTVQNENLRIIELRSPFRYFSEIIKRSFILIRNSLPNYLSHRRLRTLTNEVIKKLTEIFSHEQKPVRNLGLKLLNKFKDHIVNQIEIETLTNRRYSQFNEKQLIEEFISLVNINIEAFFTNVNLTIEDLVSFAEVQMEQGVDLVKQYIEKFKKFPSELNYLLGYILRYSTINRFIKDESHIVNLDPVNFVKNFHRFLEKRIGGVSLEWKTYILQWIKDYTNKFALIDEKRNWTLPEIYVDFLEYLENRESNEQKLENFLKFLDIYISGISNFEEKKNLLEFYKQYESSIGINEEFPKYIINKIMKEFRKIDFQVEELIPVKFFSIENSENYNSYIENNSLKYFSKLIPRPLTVILKHNLSNEEKELFREDLFHVISFKFWHNNVRFELSDNFQEVYREWLK
ncbi:MAG: hypothetical protein ACW99L_17835, partial [Promethearchaeota archaeon]